MRFRITAPLGLILILAWSHTGATQTEAQRLISLGRLSSDLLLCRYSYGVDSEAATQLIEIQPGLAELARDSDGDLDESFMKGVELSLKAVEGIAVDPEEPPKEALRRHFNKPFCDAQLERARNLTSGG